MDSEFDLVSAKLLEFELHGITTEQKRALSEELSRLKEAALGTREAKKVRYIEELQQRLNKLEPSKPSKSPQIKLPLAPLGLIVSIIILLILILSGWGPTEFNFLGITFAPKTPTVSPTETLPAPSTSTSISQPPTSLVVTPTSIPPTPTAVVPDPEEFLRSYLNELVQSRDYSDLWNKDLTPKFQAKNSPQGFAQYANNWNNVQKVYINTITITHQSDASVSAMININYRIKDGTLITNKILNWDLTYNASLSTWQLDVH